MREFAAAIIFLLVGLLLVILAAVGPVYLGPSFEGGNLGWLGGGLIIVSVYATLGISLPRLVQGQRDVRQKEDADADP